MHIVASAQDDRDYNFYMDHWRDQEPVESALLHLLEDLVADRLPEPGAVQALDSGLLALLVEESAADGGVEQLETQMLESLAFIQAHRREQPIAELMRPLHATARSIVNTVKDRGMRSVYSLTGLSTASCETLRMYVEDNRGRVQELLSSATPRQLDELSELFLDSCSGLQEMQTQREFAGSHQELLETWLSGVSMDVIRGRFSEQISSVEELARFIEDFFVFRLPWAISSFIRIAGRVTGLTPREMSATAMYFSSMVRFGVPFHEAAWAMSAGVPSPWLAIDMAREFLSEHDTSSPQAFSGWLAALDSLALTQRFGIRGQLLATVARAIAARRQNPLLAQSVSIQQLLPLEVGLVQTDETTEGWKIARARVGMPVTVARDYEDSLDRNAVVVQVADGVLGHLPRQEAQLLAPELDAGMQLTATLVEISSTAPRHIRVQIHSSV